MAKPGTETVSDLRLPTSPPPAVARWILSFVDLTGILVCFFVLLFSMKEPDSVRWKQMQQSMNKTFAPKAVVVQEQAPSGRLNAAAPAYHKSEGLVYLQQLFVRRVGDDPVWSKARLTVTGNALQIALPFGLMTASGGLSPAGTAAFGRLAGILRNWDNPMFVVAGGGNAEQQLAQLPVLLGAAGALRNNGVMSLEGVQMEPPAVEGPLFVALEVRQAD